MPKQHSALKAVGPSPVRLLQLKIQLLDISPAIWRRVLVPAAFTLEELHGVIQVAMGWESIHLYRFLVGDIYYGSSDLHIRSPRLSLAALHLRKGASFLYEYDMGDFWRHAVIVEGERDAKPGQRYPACTGGAHACPPEDCGGPDAYAERRAQARGLDAIDDYMTMAEAVEETVLNGNRDFLKDEDNRARLERALEQTEARQPFLDDEFSQRATNARFRKNEHLVLMHQQF